MRDLKLTAASAFDHSYRSLMDANAGVKSQEIKNVVGSFIANADRAGLLATVAPFLIGVSQKLSSEMQKAADAVTANPLENLELYQVQQIKSMTSVMNEILGLLNLSDPPAMVREGHKSLGFWTHVYSSVHSAMEAMLAAQIISAWTAFEMLATDMWVTCLDCRPDPLARAALHNQPKPDEEIPEPPKGQGRALKVDALLDSIVDDDLESLINPGLLLKRTKKWDFNRLFGIQDAYRCAFGEPVAKLYETPEFQSMWVHEGVRNVFVHHGGIADAMYRARVKENPALHNSFGLDGVQKGQLIPLDGTVAARLCDSAVKSSMLLIRFVDQWFIDHPVPK